MIRGFRRPGGARDINKRVFGVFREDALAEPSFVQPRSHKLTIQNLLVQLLLHRGFVGRSYPSFSQFDVSYRELTSRALSLTFLTRTISESKGDLDKEIITSQLSATLTALSTITGYRYYQNSRMGNSV